MSFDEMGWPQPSVELQFMKGRRHYVGCIDKYHTEYRAPGA